MSKQKEQKQKSSKQTCFCEPVAIHVGSIHSVYAASISSWYHPIDTERVAATALEIPVVLPSRQVLKQEEESLLDESTRTKNVNNNDENDDNEIKDAQPVSLTTPEKQPHHQTHQTPMGGSAPGSLNNTNNNNNNNNDTNNNNNSNNNSNNSAFTNPYDPSNAIDTKFEQEKLDEENENENGNDAENKKRTIREEQRVKEYALAHFESLLKDGDLADDRHLRRLMELLITPGTFLYDHDVPRYGTTQQKDSNNKNNNHNHQASSSSPDSSSRQTTFDAQSFVPSPSTIAGGGGMGQSGTTATKQPLKWNWSILKLSETNFLSSFICISNYEEYLSLGFSIHLECDSYETALRQSRWMLACGAVRLLVAPPEKENPSPSIHKDFVDEVEHGTWKKMEKQRWQHFLSAVARYTLPKRERYEGATERFFKMLDLSKRQLEHQLEGLKMLMTSTSPSSAHATPRVKVNEDADDDKNGNENTTTSTTVEKKNKPKMERIIPKKFKIPKIKPCVFAPELSLSKIESLQASSSNNNNFTLPPAKYLLNFKVMLEEMLLKGYTVQLVTDGLPSFVWKAWRNFFHLTVFSLIPNIEEDGPLSVCHATLCEGLVPGQLLTAAPKLKTPGAKHRPGMWDNSLHVRKFSQFERLKEESGFFKPLAQGARSSDEQSNVVSMLMDGLEPFFLEQQGQQAHEAQRIKEMQKRMKIERANAMMSNSTKNNNNSNDNTTNKNNSSSPLGSSNHLDQTTGSSNDQQQQQQQQQLSLENMDCSSFQSCSTHYHKICTQLVNQINHHHQKSLQMMMMENSTSSNNNGVMNSLLSPPAALPPPQSVSLERFLGVVVTSKPTSPKNNNNPSSSPESTRHSSYNNNNNSNSNHQLLMISPTSATACESQYSAALSRTGSQVFSKNSSFYFSQNFEQQQNQTEDEIPNYEGHLWLTPNERLIDYLASWRNYVLRQVSDIEFRISRLFFCSSKLLSNLQQQHHNSSSFSSSSSSSSMMMALSPDSFQNAMFVRCTCDRCTEDSQLISDCDPFVARFLHPTAKQLQRLLKKFILNMLQQNSNGNNNQNGGNASGGDESGVMRAAVGNTSYNFDAIGNVV